MKFFFFHLMPYADLDLSYADTHNSAWVTLPNTYFDPKKGTALYNRYLDEIEAAAASGFDGVCVNEHHQNAYGMMPSPGIIAGALSRRTQTAKIAVLGRALPLLNNPTVVAEEYAMLDQITGGRLVAGFVRGIGAEYHAFGANPAFSHERFMEAHDLIVQAWTRPGPFAFEGKHYQYNYVNLWPRTYQQPHPPIWIPSQGSQETIDWASHPDRRYTYLQTFSPVAVMAKYLQAYKDAAEKYGYTPKASQLGWATPCYVAETDAQARSEARQHIEAFYNKFLRMPFEMLLPPGYVSLKSMQGIVKAKAGLGGGAHTIDSLIASGMFLCGGWQTVADQIAKHQKEIGFGYLLPMGQFGTLPHDLTLKNIETFAKKVIPRVRANLGVQAEAAE